MAILLDMIAERRLVLGREQIEAVADDANTIFYDRFECGRLGVDYVNLPENDMKKVYGHVLDRHGHTAAQPSQ